MFERGKNPRALERQDNGPLAEERHRYLVRCAEQQMSRQTLREIDRYTLIVAKALRLADRPGERITSAEIKAAADRWGNRASTPRNKPKVHRLSVRFAGVATRWLMFLDRLQPAVRVSHPYADHVTQFGEHILRERGLSTRTAEHYCWVLNKFLAQLDKSGFRLATLTVAQVDELLGQWVRSEPYSRVTIRNWGAVLRQFFRFAEACKWCRPGLATAIVSPRVYSQEGLPIGPSWDDVSRVLAAAEGNRPVEIRDRALLMLLAVYGLRAGEVWTLQLENFDWDREVMTVVRGKGKRPRTYPLCRPVGDAVLRYLREARPRSDRREVFLTLVPPFRPLSSRSLGAVVRSWLHKVGLTLPHYGSHVLRHACATHLLAQGLSLEEISHHLGHRSPQATRIYAKVDLAALRTVGDFNLEGLL
jgi:site-specific recombinase XerD